MTDTIAAVATPMIPSAIGILRLSGPKAIEAADRVFAPLSGGPMARRRALARHMFPMKSAAAGRKSGPKRRICGVSLKKTLCILFNCGDDK